MRGYPAPVGMDLEYSITVKPLRGLPRALWGWTASLISPRLSVKGYPAPVGMDLA